MVKGLQNESLKGRNFALTIILGVFIAVMVIVLFNLIVSYAYEAPDYGDFCKNLGGQYPIKYGYDVPTNCSYLPELQQQNEACYAEEGMPIYNYDSQGCTISVKECDLCGKDYNAAFERYNRNTFFVFAFIGFVLIVLGLFMRTLLLQLVTLPAGAFLVIEAAVKNFDNKLAVIIVFTLLIVAAIVLALRKLK